MLRLCRQRRWLATVIRRRGRERSEETVDGILDRYKREAEALQARAQAELKAAVAAERAEGWAERELRREQLIGAHELKQYRVSEERRVREEMWADEESWLWAREELRADGWKEIKDGNEKIWWKRGPKEEQENRGAN